MATPQRARIVVLSAGAAPSWMRSIASRADLAPVTIATPAEAAGATVVVVDAASEQAAARLPALRRAAPASALLVVFVDVADAAVAAEREAAFRAGASDVFFLPGDAPRLDESIALFAGVGARRFSRFRVRLPIEVQASDAPAPMQGTLENLSAGGAQLRLPATPAMGSVWRLSLPIGRAGLQAWGLVRGAAASGESSLARVHFVGMRAPERSLLERYLDGLDRDTRTTEPMEALMQVAQLDVRALREALINPGRAADWLRAVLERVGDAERAAVLADPPDPTGSRVAVVRLRAEVTADALERYDPQLDEEPPAEAQARILAAAEAVQSLQRELSGLTSPPPTREAVDASAEHLRRAIAARFPHLAMAFEHGAGKSEALSKLDAAAGAGASSSSQKWKRRAVAVLAGLVISGAIIYTAIALSERAR